MSSSRRVLNHALARSSLPFTHTNVVAPIASSARFFPNATFQQTRAFGAAGHGAHESHGEEYAGLTISKPKNWQKYGAHFFGGLMWFWILYRFSNDYKVFLGLEHPWDGHHGDEHGHDEHDEKKEHH